MSCCQVSKRFFERMTKALTASAPSAMKVKVVAPPDENIITVGAKRFHYVEVPNFTGKKSQRSLRHFFPE